MNITNQIYLVFVSLIALTNHGLVAQEVGFSKAKEHVKAYNFEKFDVERFSLYSIGSDSEKVFFFYENLKDRKGKILFIQNNTLIDASKNYSFAIPDKESDETGYITTRSVDGRFFFYCKDYFDDTSDYGYSRLFIYDSGHEYFLDSVYNADKKIHISFSTGGRYLLVNTLNTYADYYNPEQDNRIMVYDLSEIGQGKINREYIPCMHCSDSYLVGDNLFFTIGRKDGYNGFSNKDIYMAPWRSLQDSVKIAANTDILAISPDGKSILGTRFWDRQKSTAVVVDVEQKRYQMLLGRDYAEHNAFFFPFDSKFVFDFKGYLIYVDFPEKYPFDALKWRNEQIPDWTDEEFWRPYEHTPLPEK
ncbi:hypothetical protein RT717_27850 [Imperialibacter roseus]|uniref:Uncharacterized protein n=1 Tax=Imperialibacter roseus TaxID=1324217 RepID=A0ABZ0IPC8_9BACT|nr:hypothetical protein [Imperialibacter roseus]WOK06887.1 hypothetical protein RT717_27850 [Imperialibacter roseus]